MSGTAAPQPAPGGVDYQSRSKRSAVAEGVGIFAGVLLITVSVIQILEGISAIAKDKIYVLGVKYVYEFDVTTWGWIHLVIGIVALGAGIAVLAGRNWGRIIGIGVAVISIIANFIFLPYYPFWSITIIAILVFVIWALSSQIASERS